VKKCPKIEKGMSSTKSAKTYLGSRERAFGYVLHHQKGLQGQREATEAVGS